MPNATSSVLVVRFTVPPPSVQPEVLEDETQTPEMEKQPAVIFKPLARVEVEFEVPRIDPPVIVNPLDDDNPAVPMPPVKVLVPVVVTLTYEASMPEVAIIACKVLVPVITAAP